MVEISVDTALIVAIASLTVTIILTLLNATILEARRDSTKRDTEKKALQEALYNEIGWTINYIVTTIAEQRIKSVNNHSFTSWKALKTYLSEAISLDVFRYTREHPTLFYELKDAYNIEYFYRRITEIYRSLDEYEKRADGKNREDQSAQVVSFLEGPLRIILREAIFALDVEKLRKVAIDWPDHVIAEKSEDERKRDASQFIDDVYARA